MKPAWTILNYHEINWEENPYLSAVGGTYSPDVFRRDVSRLAQVARLISVDDGLDLWKQGKVDHPLVSFWFDDAYVGVRKYAFPILREFGIRGALSVNSRFVLRQEMFWRCQLSYLANTDGLRFLRAKMRKLGYTSGPLREATLDLFSEELRQAIQEVYESFTRPRDREDAFRIFDTPEGLRALHEEGWLLANHSAAHYPLLEPSSIHFLEEHFMECERFLQGITGARCEFWVAPFDREAKRAPDFLSQFEAVSEGRRLVMVGHLANGPFSYNKPIFRCWTPADTSGLVEMLSGLSVG